MNSITDFLALYYIVKRNGKMAIFNKNSERITRWWVHIYENGLIEGKSNYYLAINKDNPSISISK